MQLTVITSNDFSPEIFADIYITVILQFLLTILSWNITYVFRDQFVNHA